MAGAKKSPVEIGDHVVMVFVTSCGACADCVGGRPNLCAASARAKAQGTLIAGGHRMHLDGRPINHAAGISCFAEFAVVSRNSVVVIDRDVPLEDAASYQPSLILSHFTPWRFGLIFVASQERVAPQCGTL